ncbi:Hypothetical predicted protein [Pelobates cultripes]|uniref:Uncharacterized protein n=1 Tax=Pelobates cultripes TaxID=61616 RepID=A0AAD1RH01_PELCU|nr:Hypothetical predicted protein [Pelobates cultripes]
MESRLDSLFAKFWQQLESRQLYHAPSQPKDHPHDLQAPDHHRESSPLTVKKAQIWWSRKRHKQWSSPKLKVAHMLKSKHGDKPEKQRRALFLIYVLICRLSSSTKRLKHSFKEMHSALPTEGTG